MRGRLAVLSLVTGVLVLVAVGAVVATRGTGGYVTDTGGAADGASIEPPADGAADPVTALDTALAEGQPAYILIHSLT